MGSTSKSPSMIFSLKEFQGGEMGIQKVAQMDKAAAISTETVCWECWSLLHKTPRSILMSAWFQLYERRKKERLGEGKAGDPKPVSLGQAPPLSPDTDTSRHRTRSLLLPTKMIGMSSVCRALRSWIRSSEAFSKLARSVME